MRKSPTSQTEKSFTAYVQGNQADTALETVNVYAGGLAGPANTTVADPSTLQPQPNSPPVVTPPSLVFTASNPEQLSYDAGIYELKLNACLSTEIFDEQVTDAEDTHRERLEVLRDMLEDGVLLQTYVNAPTGTDTRLVKDFHLSAIAYEDESTMVSENKIVTDISYYIAMAPNG